MTSLRPAGSSLHEEGAQVSGPHAEEITPLSKQLLAYYRDVSNVAIFGVTSLSADRADPATIAKLVRGQWGIESLHWIRDTLYREDQSTARTRNGPRVMAALRNLAIGALRLIGRNDVTEATRWATRDMTRTFTILGLS